jgi:hypothetical protein
MNLDEYKARYGADQSAAPGWDAIDERLKQFYPGVEPMHYASTVKFALGGPDPLDGISIYRCGPPDNWHFHYVSYGFSSLYYAEQAVGKDFSGFGFELTFRLKPFAGDHEWPTWPVKVMQNLARYVFQSRKWFEDHHWIPAGGPIRADTQTEITGAAFVTDPQLGLIHTPHGRVQFLQMVGITTAELVAIQGGTLEVKALLEQLAARDPLLVTDLTRR